MASRYMDPDGYPTPEGKGEEARPRPLKTRKLLDVMDGESPKAAPAVASRPASDTRSVARITPKPTRKSTAKPPERRASAAAPSGVTVGSPVPVTASAHDPATLAPPAAVAIPADAFAVLSVAPEGEGETIAVVLSVPSSMAAQIKGGKEVPEDGAPVRVKLHLLVEQYADLKPTVGEITPEQAAALTEAGYLCSAIRRGMILLGYGDPSALRLTYKLTLKGFDRETAAAAVVYLVKKGYVREDNAAALRAEQNRRKGWGPRRIREDLRAQGFPSDVTEEAMESLAEVDWAETCAEVICKKYGEIPTDRGARQKLIAAVMRLGYDADTVREAMRVILRES